jgi:hypothetical protein
MSRQGCVLARAARPGRNAHARGARRLLSGRGPDERCRADHGPGRIRDRAVARSQTGRRDPGRRLGRMCGACRSHLDACARADEPARPTALLCRSGPRRRARRGHVGPAPLGQGGVPPRLPRLPARHARVRVHDLAGGVDVRRSGVPPHRAHDGHCRPPVHSGLAGRSAARYGAARRRGRAGPARMLDST